MQKVDGRRRGAALGDDQKVDVKRFGQVSGVIQRVVDTGQATLVTDNGVTVAAIVDAETYRALLLQQLRHDLEVAAAEANAGHLVEHEEVMRELRERFRGRVPDALLKAFNGE